MTLAGIVSRAKRVAATLKFRVVVLGVLLTLAVSVLTTGVVLDATETNMQRVILRSEAGSTQRLAQAFSAALETQQKALATAMTGLTRADMAQPAALAGRLRGARVLSGMYDLIGIADAQGQVLAMVEAGQPRAGRPISATGRTSSARWPNGPRRFPKSCAAASRASRRSPSPRRSAIRAARSSAWPSVACVCCPTTCSARSARRSRTAAR